MQIFILKRVGFLLLCMLLVGCSQQTVPKEIPKERAGEVVDKISGVD